MLQLFSFYRVKSWIFCKSFVEICNNKKRIFFGAFVSLTLESVLGAFVSLTQESALEPVATATVAFVSLTQESVLDATVAFLSLLQKSGSTSTWQPWCLEAAGGR